MSPQPSAETNGALGSGGSRFLAFECLQGVVQLPRSPIELDPLEPVSDCNPEYLVENSATQVAEGTPDDLGQVRKALP